MILNHLLKKMLVNMVGEIVNFKDKKWIGFILVIIGFIVVIIGLISSQDNNKLGKTKNAIENIFFYLPESSYDNLSEMPDYCKVSLVYGTEYVKKDALLSYDDYDTIVKKNGVSAYKLETITKGIHDILGDNVSINFEKNNDNEYDLLYSNDCIYGNSKLNNLSYNENHGYFFSMDREEEANSKLYVKWMEPEYKDDLVILKAKALLAIKNASGGYDVFANKDLTYKAGEVSSKDKIEDLYYMSLDYKFTLKDINDKYIWTKYEVIDNIYNEDVIYD